MCVRHPWEGGREGGRAVWYIVVIIGSGIMWLSVCTCRSTSVTIYMYINCTHVYMYMYGLNDSFEEVMLHVHDDMLMHILYLVYIMAVAELYWQLAEQVFNSHCLDF